MRKHDLQATPMHTARMCLSALKLWMCRYLEICKHSGVCNVQEQGVFETLIGKKQQMFLATQVCKMILKIDDVMSPAAYE